MGLAPPARCAPPSPPAPQPSRQCWRHRYLGAIRKLNSSIRRAIDESLSRFPSHSIQYRDGDRWNEWEGRDGRVK